MSIPPGVERLARQGAWVCYSVSGGKDSAAQIAVADPMLDAIGHPREKRLILHADLGRSEWDGTHHNVQAIARYFELPVHIVRHPVHDMPSRWMRRGDLGRERWARFETTRLIGPWSNSNSLFCRSEMKLHPMARFKAKLGGPVISIVGIRRQESTRRASAPDERIDGDLKRYGSTVEAMLWHPIADMLTHEVFELHQRMAIPLHQAYTLGSTRVSCQACVLASHNDLSVGARHPANLERHLLLVGMEADYAFSFQPDRWLADVAPEIVPDRLTRRVERAKEVSALRKHLEAQIPACFDPKNPQPPSDNDNALIKAIRREIATAHNIENAIMIA